MATVRIYRVAELLNTTSQEVIALLKRDHGIEVKSASSTIEEVVAREFVSRLARQRGIKVPSNASFADAPAVVRGGAKKPAGKRAGTAEARRPVDAGAAAGEDGQADRAAGRDRSRRPRRSRLIPAPAPVAIEPELARRPPIPVEPEPEPVVVAPAPEVRLAEPPPPSAPPAPDVPVGRGRGRPGRAAAYGAAGTARSDARRQADSCRQRCVFASRIRVRVRRLRRRRGGRCSSGRRSRRLRRPRRPAT